ncbi:hypothetical protein AgCh_000871 [Apium graveolens]
MRSLRACEAFELAKPSSLPTCGTSLVTPCSCYCKLGARLTEVRKNGTCAKLRPDGKTQVTVEYYNDKGAMVPIRVHKVLISTQHDETVTNDEIAADLKKHVIKPIIPAKYLDAKTIFHLNPSGRFVIGGPHGDAGLTGRKIIIDTYGGWGAHGGGAFSGKDPTKVDRSGAYIVRQAAKSIVASGLARRCIVQVSYAIGVPEPLSVFVDSYGTAKIPDKEILKIVKETFDFRPGMIAINLDLKRGGNGRPGEGNEHWCLPSGNKIKINVDVAISDDMGRFEFGWIAGDASVRVQEAKKGSRMGTVDSGVDEALGVKEVFDLAQEY